MLPTLIIIIVILSILIYIHINYSKDNIVNKEHFIVPTDSNFLNNLTISRNKENYIVLIRFYVISFVSTLRYLIRI